MIQSPLTVRLSTPTGDRLLDVSDLEFSRTARGGFRAASFTLPEWVTAADPTLSMLAKCRIHDSRNASVQWEGSLDLPGRAVGTDGHTWQVGAVGAMSLLGDYHRPWICVDTDLEPWYRKYTGKPGSTAESSSLPGDETTPALLMLFPAGLPLDNSSVASMQYDRLYDSGQYLGGFRYSYVSGVTTATYELHAVVRIGVLGSSGNSTVRSAEFTTTAATAPASSAGSAFGSNVYNQLTFRIVRTGGATTVSTDNGWTAFYDIWVRSQLIDQAGAYISGVNTYADGFVYAHQAVIDALWRFTDQLDIPNASIDTTFTHQIDQLAYPDGTRLPDILADLTLFEPDLTYQVGPSNTAGKHSFKLGRYPTTVRYEATTADGWSAPGGEAAVANSIRVYYTDRRGKPQSQIYTRAVPALDQWGRTRDADPLTLGIEVGSLGAANRIGPQTLAQLADVADAGTLTVARPIRDLLTGRNVMPWEIEPGELVNVRDIDAPPLRLTEMSYQDSSQAATLTLGEPTFTTEELVARYVANAARRRRGRK